MQRLIALAALRQAYARPDLYIFRPVRVQAYAYCMGARSLANPQGNCILNQLSINTDRLANSVLTLNLNRGYLAREAKFTLSTPPEVA